MEHENQEFPTFGAEFSSQLQLLELFAHLPDACVCVKNRQGRFVWANQAEIALHGMSQIGQLTGKTDFDIYENRLAEQYSGDDHRVMTTKSPSWNQVWLLSDHFSRLQWFVCSKVPLYAEGKEAHGIAIVMRQLAQARPMVAAYHGMESVLSEVVNRHAEPIRIQELADMVHLSHSQFDRRFKEVFRQTPQQYILQVRLNAACHALCHTDDSMAEIAVRTGFSDQSHFTRQFRSAMNLTPLAYRKKYRSQD
ncbi:helix-turn-helix domain-containing protein [Planctomicrobium sp. SH661]|uniref:AraC family transcriptional regulator n=1 Tax=Planctomicrobium sp. SH661 TaxID=3448124 RepID=UPI003F5B44A9